VRACSSAVEQMSYTHLAPGSNPGRPTNKNMREIEVKLKVDNLQDLENKLLEKGCRLSNPIHQQDFIYSKKGSTEEWENSKVGHVVMRLRRQDGEAVFNLKQQRSTEMDNIEIETKIENPEAIHQILSILGYEPQVEVKKVRKKGELGEYEICLDEVEKLGSYVELEKLTSDDADPVKVVEELLQELETFGLSRSSREERGYDSQIYAQKNR
jgi:adenylate cyclase, class 2